jgi:HTH-type transcriptional regulator, cell division transcriptional repressor
VERLFYAMKHTQKRLKAKNVIGSRVRIARGRLHPSVSQDDLSGRLAARGIRINRTGISKIENGERYLMDYEIIALAKCLKTTAGWLFGETEEEK